jgi:hypothetical protein
MTLTGEVSIKQLGLVNTLEKQELPKDQETVSSLIWTQEAVSVINNKCNLPY